MLIQINFRSLFVRRRRKEHMNRESRERDERRETKRETCGCWVYIWKGWKKQSFRAFSTHKSNLEVVGVQFIARKIKQYNVIEKGENNPLFVFKKYLLFKEKEEHFFFFLSRKACERKKNKIIKITQIQNISLSLAIF